MRLLCINSIIYYVNHRRGDRHPLNITLYFNGRIPRQHIQKCGVAAMEVRVLPGVATLSTFFIHTKTIKVMNETYKKVDDLAHFVQQHAKEHPEMATIIISSPNVEDDKGTTLCATSGTGANLIEMLATALTDNDNLLKFVKDAVALVEGTRVMGRLARARQMKYEEERGEKESGCDNEEPTTDACGKVREERGPEPAGAKPE